MDNLDTFDKVTNGIKVAFWVGQIGLVVLKLFNAISWSWLWVLSPLWIGASIIILIVLGFIIYANTGVEK